MPLNDRLATLTARKAGLLTTTFLTMGLFTPAPSDMYFGFHLRLRGTSPDLSALRSHIGERVSGIPLLTHRLVLDGGRARWEPDADFDIDHHVRQADGAGLDPRPARELLDTPPDESRPRWCLWLHPGDGKEWALSYLAHHAVQDATAMLHTLRLLLSTRDVRVPTPPQEEPPHGWRKATGLVPLLPDVLATYLPPATPASAPSGDHSTALGHAAVDLAVLRNVAESTGTTINQVHLAALATALHQWQPTRGNIGQPWWRAAPHVIVPVDTRSGPGDVLAPPYGNRIGLLRVPVPRAGETLADFLTAIAPSSSRRHMARRRGALRTLTDHAPTRLGGWVLRRITNPRGLLLTASHIRASELPTALDDQVVQLTAIPWLPPGNNCFTLLVTHGETARLSVLTSTVNAAPGTLASLWAEALVSNQVPTT